MGWVGRTHISPLTAPGFYWPVDIFVMSGLWWLPLLLSLLLERADNALCGPVSDLGPRRAACGGSLGRDWWRRVALMRTSRFGMSPGGQPPWSPTPSAFSRIPVVGTGRVHLPHAQTQRTRQRFYPGGAVPWYPPEEPVTSSYREMSVDGTFCFALFWALATCVVM